MRVCPTPWMQTGYSQQVGGMHPTEMHSCQTYVDVIHITEFRRNFQQLISSFAGLPGFNFSLIWKKYVNGGESIDTDM